MADDDISAEAVKSFDYEAYDDGAKVCNRMYEKMAAGEITIDNLSEEQRQLIRSTTYMTPLLKPRLDQGEGIFELVGVGHLYEGVDWAFGTDEDGKLSVYGIDDEDNLPPASVTYYFWTKNARHAFHEVSHLKAFVEAYRN